MAKRANSPDRREERKRKKNRPKRGAVVIGTQAKVPQVKPKTENQERYIQAIGEHPVVFGVGPAGTGKTFLACFLAAKRLVEGDVKRIILVRPAVEAGEKLGFLPGRLEDKLDPYLRPLYDALNDLIGFEATKTLVRDRVIEVVPLAYMRGRTLNHAFVILDEAQNTNIRQMKMFLTRMGNHSNFVVNGDITQTDLDNNESGLIDAYKRLRNVEGVYWQEFHQGDIVRHPVVQRIVEAYSDDVAF